MPPANADNTAEEKFVPSTRLRLNATMVKGYIQYGCERKLRYEMLSGEARKDLGIREVDKGHAWRKHGNDFERWEIERLALRGGVLRPGPGNETLTSDQVRDFFSRRAADRYAYQVEILPGDGFRRRFKVPPEVELGHARLDLVHATDGSGDGSPTFRVIDIKATGVATTFHKAQVAYYACVVEEYLRAEGLPGQVDVVGEVWHHDRSRPGGCEQEQFSRPSYDGLVAEALAALPSIVGKVIEVGRDDTFFHLYYKCEQCSFLEHCDAPGRCGTGAGADLSDIPGISHSSKRFLHAQGVRTVGEFCALLERDPRSLRRVHTLRTQGGRLAARARALIDGLPRWIPGASTFFAAARADIRIFLAVEEDPITGRLGALALRVDRDAPAPGAPCAPVEMALLPASSTAEGERDLLAQGLGRVVEVLHQADAANAASAAPEVRLHIYVYDPSEAAALERALGRNIQTDEVRAGLIHLLRMMPPEEVPRGEQAPLGEPGYAGREHLPGTALRSAIEDVLALPVRVSYDLAAVGEALARSPGATAGAVPPLARDGVHAPPPLLRGRFSSRIPLDALRSVLGDEPVPGIDADVIRAELLRRLAATAALERWLVARNLERGDLLRLEKVPFRLLAAYDPLGAGDVDVLIAIEELEDRGADLQSRIKLAAPADTRVARGDTLGPLVHREDETSESQWKSCHAFTASPDAADTRIEAGSFDLVLTNGVSGRLLADLSPGRVAVRLYEANPVEDGSLVYRVEAKREDLDAATRTEPALLDLSAPCYVDQRYRDATLPQRIALLRFLQKKDPADRIRDNILALLRRAGDYARAPHPAGSPAASLDESYLRAVAERVPRTWARSGHTLDASQRAALEQVGRSRATVIWGPPGTGKTRLLGEVVALRLLCADQLGSRERVFVTAFTRRAVANVLDAIAEALERHGADLSRFDLLRMSPGGDDEPDVSPQVEDLQLRWPDQIEKAGSRLRTLKRAAVGATVFGLHKVISKLDGGGRPAHELFDVVLVDEASQMLVTHAAMAFAGLEAGGRVVLAGDDRQLPPVRAKREVSCAGLPLGGSIYDLFRESKVPVCLLTRNFRMNEPLTRFPADAIYPGYQAARPERELALCPGWEAGLGPIEHVVLDPQLPVVVLVHDSGFSGSMSPFETDLTARLAARIAPRLRRPDGTGESWLVEEGLAIVSPHRAQNAALRKAAGARLPRGQELPVIDTVDRIQGSEREVILAAYTVSDREYALQEAGFIFSPNRFTVTVTRARAKLVLIVSKQLLSCVPEDSEALRGAELLRGFVEACSHVRTDSVSGPDGSVRVEVRASGFRGAPPAPANGGSPGPGITEPRTEVSTTMSPQPLPQPQPQPHPQPQPQPAATLDARSVALLAKIREIAAANSEYGTAWSWEVEKHATPPLFAALRPLAAAGEIRLVREVATKKGMAQIIEPLAPPRPALPATAESVLASIGAVIKSEAGTYTSAYYSSVRARYLWWDDAGGDVLLPVLRGLEATGHLVIETKPNKKGGTFLVVGPGPNLPAVAEDVPDAEDGDGPPEEALGDDDWRILNALEDIDAEAIALGVLETAPTDEEVIRRAGPTIARPGEAIDRVLRTRHAMRPFPGRLRSRIAEICRTVRHVKQRFRPNDAAERPYLVRSLKLEIRPRKKPVRNETLATVLAAIGARLVAAGHERAPAVLDALLAAARRVFGESGGVPIPRFQAEAIESILPAYLGLPPAGKEAGPDAFAVAADTGSGKTEAALFPLLAGASLDRLAGRQGTKAIFVYPRIRLAVNQLERFIRYLAALASVAGMPHLRIGLQSKDVLRSFVAPLAGAAEDRGAAPEDGSDGGAPGAAASTAPGESSEKQEAQKQRAQRQENPAERLWKAPAADGSYEFPFFGCPHCRAQGARRPLRLHPGKGDPDLLACTEEGCGFRYDAFVGSKGGLTKTPPDLFLTTTESLHAWLADDRAGALFGDDPAFTTPRAVLVDEMHLYSHVQGAQVALVLRRLRARLALNLASEAAARREPLAIGMSATIADPCGSFERLAGVAPELVRPAPEDCTPSLEGREYFLFVQPEIESRGRDVATAATTIQTVMAIAHQMRRRRDSGYRGLLFFDSLDKVKRLHAAYLDAETSSSKRLASLRTTRFPDGSTTCCRKPETCARFMDGECWFFEATDEAQCGVRRNDPPGRPLEVMRRPVFSGTSDSVEKEMQRSDLVFATSSLEVGVDDPDITFVYQHRAPANLASFIQRKGRGGRGIKDRPITGATLSAYSPRDAYFFARPSLILDDGRFVVPLNPDNYFVARGQALAAVFDVLARAAFQSRRALPPRDLSGLSELKRRMKDLEPIAARVLRRVAPQLVRQGVTPSKILGDAPHTLSPGRPWFECMDWIPRRLFDGINLPLVRCWYKDDGVGRTENEDIGIALGEFAPGKVTRRYGRTEAHWVYPGEGGTWLAAPDGEEGQSEPICDGNVSRLLDWAPRDLRDRLKVERIEARVLRPSYVELRGAGRFSGATFTPSYRHCLTCRRTFYRENEGDVALHRGRGCDVFDVSHESQGQTFGFFVVEEKEGAASTHPLPAGLRRLGGAIEIFRGGSTDGPSGLVVWRIVAGAHVQLKLVKGAGPSLRREEDTSVRYYKDPDYDRALARGFKLETEGIRWRLDRAAIAGFVVAFDDRIAKEDTRFRRWLWGRCLRHRLGQDVAALGLEPQQAGPFADLLMAASADPDLRPRLKKSIRGEEIDDVEMQAALLLAFDRYFSFHPTLTKKRAEALLQSALAKPEVLARALEEAVDPAAFRRYLGDVAIHSLEHHLRDRFVIHGCAEERRILGHARLHTVHGGDVDATIRAFEDGSHGDGTTRTFERRKTEAFVDLLDVKVAACPHADEDAFIDRALDPALPHAAEIRAIRAAVLAGTRERRSGLEAAGIAVAGTPLVLSDRPELVAALGRILFGEERFGQTVVAAFDLYEEVRRLRERLETRFERPAATHELVGAAVAGASAGDPGLPKLKELLDAYRAVPGMAADDDESSLGPESRLADQVFRRSARLCPDGCLACLAARCDMLPQEAVPASVSRRILRELLEFALEPISRRVDSAADLAAALAEAEADLSAQAGNDVAARRILVAPALGAQLRDTCVARFGTGAVRTAYDPITCRVIVLITSRTTE